MIRLFTDSFRQMMAEVDYINDLLYLIIWHVYLNTIDFKANCAIYYPTAASTWSKWILYVTNL